MGSKNNKYGSHACRGSHACQGKYAVKRESPKSGSAVGGCRIVNMDQLQKFVAQVSSQSRSCQNGSIYREGLASVLSATCSSCRMEAAFPTSSKVTGLGGGQRWECNLAAVWGQMSTSEGYAPLAETMSCWGCR